MKQAGWRSLYQRNDVFDEEEEEEGGSSTKDNITVTTDASLAVDKVLTSTPSHQTEIIYKATASLY